MFASYSRDDRRVVLMGFFAAGAARYVGGEKKR